MRVSLVCLTALAGISLGGCGYNGLYSGVSVGYGSGYGSYGYGRYGYDRFHSGYYGSPYWGWYDSFYYPGTGFYVYDRYRRPFRWSDRHRRYWTDRRQRFLSTSRTIVRERPVVRENWSGFTRDRQRIRTERRDRERTIRTQRRDRERTVRAQRRDPDD